MSRAFPFHHEVVDKNNQRQLSFTYNDSGDIGNIFTYSPQLDTEVMVDRATFEDRHPSAFAVMQMSVQCALAEMREKHESDEVA